VVDTVAAIRELLLSDPTVNLMTEARVFGGELPTSEIESMPRDVVVVAYAGGDPHRGTTPVFGTRLMVWCWSKSFNTAGRLDAAVFDVLDNVIRVTIGHVLIHAVMPVGAPTAYKDPDYGWPAYARSVTAVVDQREVGA
jgi:hypothetical protein